MGVPTVPTRSIARDFVRGIFGAPEPVWQWHGACGAPAVPSSWPGGYGMPVAPPAWYGQFGGMAAPMVVAAPAPMMMPAAPPHASGRQPTMRPTAAAAPAGLGGRASEEDHWVDGPMPPPLLRPVDRPLHSASGAAEPAGLAAASVESATAVGGVPPPPVARVTPAVMVPAAAETEPVSAEGAWVDGLPPPPVARVTSAVAAPATVETEPVSAADAWVDGPMPPPLTMPAMAPEVAIAAVPASWAEAPAPPPPAAPPRVASEAELQAERASAPAQAGSIVAEPGTAATAALVAREDGIPSLHGLAAESRFAEEPALETCTSQAEDDDAFGAEVPVVGDDDERLFGPCLFPAAEDHGPPLAPLEAEEVESASQADHIELVGGGSKPKPLHRKRARELVRRATPVQEELVMIPIENFMTPSRNGRPARPRVPALRSWMGERLCGVRSMQVGEAGATVYSATHVLLVKESTDLPATTTKADSPAAADVPVPDAVLVVATEDAMSEAREDHVEEEAERELIVTPPRKKRAVARGTAPAARAPRRSSMGAGREPSRRTSFPAGARARARARPGARPAEALALAEERLGDGEPVPQEWEPLEEGFVELAPATAGSRAPIRFRMGTLGERIQTADLHIPPQSFNAPEKLGEGKTVMIQAFKADANFCQIILDGKVNHIGSGDLLKVLPGSTYSLRNNSESEFARLKVCMVYDP